MSWQKRIGSSPALPGYTLLLGAIIVNIFVQGLTFFSVNNFNSIMTVNTPLIIAAIAQTIVLLAGGIDLSIGSSITLVNTIIIVLLNTYHWSLGAAILAALAAGILIGIFNGIIVAFLRIPPLLATFSTMSIIGGIALLVLPTPGGSVPPVLYKTYGGTTLGIPNTVFIIALMAIIWGVICKYPLGKYIRSVGGSERSSYIAGINIGTTKFLAYVLSGFMAAVAGISLTAQTASGDPKIGLAIALNSIAAVVLGGTRLSGGWGKVGGSVAGALFLGLVNNIVFFFFNNYITHISFLASKASFIQQLLTNLIIILGLASAVLTQRRKPKAGT